MKRITILCLFIIMTPFIVSAYLKGDINGDNKVNSMDYILIRKHILKTKELTGDELNRADVDGRNGVTVADYIMVRKIILGLLAPTPQELNVSANFIVQDSSGVITSSTTESCTIKSGETSCKITVPKLTANTGYTAIGWNTLKEATDASVKSNSTISITNDINYYSISKNDKALLATFEVVTKATASKKSEKCYLYNGNSSCKIIAPTITPNTGYEVVGWSDNTDKDEASILSGGAFQINKSIKLYTIVKKTVTITFNSNENLNNSDYLKTNIKADKLSFYNTTCISYNDKGCRITREPIIYSKGNVTHGFSLTKNGESIEVERKKFKDDTVLYARIYNYVNAKKKGSTKRETFALGGYNIVNSKTYGNIVVEFQDSITDTEYIDYIFTYLNLLFKEHPELFYYNGKIMFLDNNTYTDAWQTASYSGNTGGITHYRNGYSVIFMNKRAAKQRACFTLTHELGHAYDRNFYQIMDGYISNRDIIKDLFNKYLNGENKPFRPYSFNLSSDDEEEITEDNTKTTEFVADLIAYGTAKDFSVKRIVVNGADGKKYSYITKPDKTYDKNNYITSELYNEYLSLMNEGYAFFKNVGIIK